jgi:hypothetical protein
MRTYQNEHNMLLKLNFPRCPSILLQTTYSETTTMHSTLTLLITSNLEKHNLIQQTALRSKLNAKFPWPPIMPKQRECILDINFCMS